MEGDEERSWSVGTQGTWPTHEGHGEGGADGGQHPAVDSVDYERV